MTIDVCSRVWPGSDPWRAPVKQSAGAGGRPAGAAGSGEASPDASPAAHEAAMHCVRCACVVGYRSERLGVHLPAERIMAFVGAEPTRRIGVVGIDPAACSSAEDLAQAAELGASGVAISPADQDCRATDDRCLRVLEWCAGRGMPVWVCNPGALCGPSVLEYMSPLWLDEAARTIPHLRLVLGDPGRAFLDEALLLAAKHEGVFVEISTLVGRPGLLQRGLTGAYERGVIDKVLFASGFPYERPDRAIERMYTLNSFGAGTGGMYAVPREALRSIVERDALRCLGIERPAGSDARASGRAGAGAQAKRLVGGSAS